MNIVQRMSRSGQGLLCFGMVLFLTACSGEAPANVFRPTTAPTPPVSTESVEHYVRFIAHNERPVNRELREVRSCARHIGIPTNCDLTLASIGDRMLMVQIGMEGPGHEPKFPLPPQPPKVVRALVFKTYADAHTVWRDAHATRAPLTPSKFIKLRVALRRLINEMSRWKRYST
jgi:hypothetical protein